MRSQTAFDLLKSAKEIRVALDTNGSQIAASLAEKYPPPIVDDRPLIEYDRQIQHLVHGLQAAEAQVIETEDAHMKQVVRVSRLRSERDEAASTNYDKLLAARQGLDGLQGIKGSFETAFVAGRAPRQPDRLLDQLAQSVALLDDPPVELRAVKIAGFDIEPKAMARDLEAGMNELSAIVDRLDAENKITESTMLVRRKAIAELKNTVIWAGRTAEGLFQRADEPELAKRIRTSTRRQLRPSEQASAPADSEPETSTEASTLSPETPTEASPETPPEVPGGEPATSDPETGSGEPATQPATDS